MRGEGVLIVSPNLELFGNKFILSIFTNERMLFMTFFFPFHLLLVLDRSIMLLIMQLASS